VTLRYVSWYTAFQSESMLISERCVSGYITKFCGGYYSHPSLRKYRKK